MSDNVLINTLECPGEFDALTNLRPGEIYFMLVSRDRLAPPLICEWADKNRRRALAKFEAGEITMELRDRECRKSTQAEMIASSMVEQKNGWEDAKIENAPPTTYSGHEMPEHIKLRDAIQSARANAIRALHNSIAEVNDLAGIENDPVLSAEIDLILGEMRRVAEVLSPKRPGPTPLLDT